MKFGRMSTVSFVTPLVVILVMLTPTSGEVQDSRRGAQVIETAMATPYAIPAGRSEPINTAGTALLDFYAKPTLSDGFGSRQGRWRAHTGLDIPHPEGTPIPSLLGGEVVTSEWDAGLGWIVEVRQDDGRYVGYRHLLQPGAPVGARVETADVVGLVGDTGYSSQGSHLCTTNSPVPGGVFGGGTGEDPWPYIQRYMAEAL